MKDLLQALRLSHLDTGLPDLYEQARLHGLTYEAFLRRVLLLEIEGRKLTAQQKRLQAARLPVRKTLEEFDFTFQPSMSERLIEAISISGKSYRMKNRLVTGKSKAERRQPGSPAAGEEEPA